MRFTTGSSPEQMLISTASANRGDTPVPVLWQLAHELMAEQKPSSVLERLCSHTGEILDAKLSVVAIIEETQQQFKLECVTGPDGRGLPAVRDSFDLGVLTTLVPDLTPIRLNNTRGTGLPPELATKSGKSFLGVQLRTLTKLYGIMCLWGKSGAGRFTKADEAIAVTVADLAAVAYENSLQREALRDWESRFRALNSQQVSGREEERLRLARAIHDDLGQDLTAIKIEVRLLERKLPSDRSEVIQRLASIGSSVDNLIHQMQCIATDLRLPVLDLGLARGIRVYSEQFQARTGIICQVVADEFMDLDLPRAIAIFRVFQESLTNVACHSEATQVRVTLRRAEENVILKVKDNGRGIARNPPDSSSLGILGMRERVAQFNGNLVIHSRRAAGTTVAMSLPLI
jgi:signal transduction histidine kinase